MKNKNRSKECELAFQTYVQEFSRFEVHKNSRIKCWEFMKCSPNVRENCPAFLKSAGRRCWLIAGTIEGNAAKCAFTGKERDCKKCDFYKKVKRGEI